MKKLLFLLCLLLAVPAYATEPTDSENAVRYIIDEAAASFWTSAQIQEWLDQAIYDIASRTLCLQTSDTITLATSTYEYSTTAGSVSVANIMKILGAFYLNPDDEYIGLERIDPSDISKLAHMKAGPPKYYYQYASKIGILPLPTSGQNGDSVRIYFARLPLQSTLATRIAELPTQYHNAMYYYAAEMAYRKEHRVAEANAMRTLYENEIKTLRGDLIDVPAETPEK